MTDLARFLPGTWHVERTLDDAALGTGRFRGSATFTPDEEGLAWVETGRMTFGGYGGPASRTLRLVRDAGGWEVRFPDGRPFHRLDPADGHCAFVHPCGDDRYAGEFAVRGPDAFEIDWSVSGPAKAQRLTGRYVRSASSCSRNPAASST